MITIEVRIMVTSWKEGFVIRDGLDGDLWDAGNVVVGLVWKCVGIHVIGISLILCKTYIYSK